MAERETTCLIRKQYYKHNEKNAGFSWWYPQYQDVEVENLTGGCQPAYLFGRQEHLSEHRVETSNSNNSN